VNRSKQRRQMFMEVADDDRRRRQRRNVICQVVTGMVPSVRNSTVKIESGAEVLIITIK
jgi:hypothetical protein